MKNSKKLFTVIAMALCFSFCVGTASHAETMIKYKEISYGSLVTGLKTAEGYSVSINSSGRLEINLYDYAVSKAAKKAEGKKLSGKKYKRYARVTFDSKGKKKVNVMSDIYRKPWDKKIYGNRAYGINKKKLVVMTKSGKVIKTIKLDVSKYLKKKTDSVNFRIAEIKGKNRVQLYYRHLVGNRNGNGYGGIIEVNPATGKIKKLVSTDEFYPREYDGKNIYGCVFEPKGYRETPKNVTFFMKSLKTGKTEKFKTDAISYDTKKYSFFEPMYSFYKGGIMGVEPDGKVFYGTFSSKKFEQVGDISGCKYFEKYGGQWLVMKSRNEFYIIYDTALSKDEEPDSLCRKLNVVKYQNKK